MSSFKKMIVLFFLLFLFVNGKDTFSQTRYPGELNFAVEGIGINEGWTVTYSSQSFSRWFDDNGEKYITDEYSSGSISGTGNTYGYQGFDSPDDVGPGVPIAYGYYLFTYEFDEHGDTPTIEIDLYDANWSTQGYPGSHDICIKWNDSEKRFYYQNYCTNYKWDILGTGISGQYLKIWELFEVEADQEPFELPPPEDLSIINLLEIGEHPILTWTEFSGSAGFSIKYKVYRNENNSPYYCVWDDLSNGSWQDPDVIIAPKWQGVSVKYYVTAYTANSPESDPSNVVLIWSYPYKAIPDASQPGIEENQFSTSKDLTCLALKVNPNPFNPLTRISYQVPVDGNVHITI